MFIEEASEHISRRKSGETGKFDLISEKIRKDRSGKHHDLTDKRVRYLIMKFHGLSFCKS